MNKTQVIQAKAMKKLYALTTKRAIDLSLSENPLGCSPLVTATLDNLKTSLNDYPLANGQLLKQALADSFKLSPDNFFVANGSEAIINHLSRVFGGFGGQVVLPALTFPLFAISAELVTKKIVRVKMTTNLGIDLTAMAKAVSTQTRLVFLCNPNNPTGALLSRKAILQFLDGLPSSVLLVVDEANIEFAGQSVLAEVKNRDNLIVLRTFSKAFGLASLRVGFAVASSQLIQRLEEATPPFPISGVSEQLAIVALKDQDFLARTQKFVARERLFLEKELKELGFQVFPGQANNLFVKIPEFLTVRQFLDNLQDSDISVVMGSSFEGFSDEFFRISVRDERTNRQFIEKIKSAFSSLLTLMMKKFYITMKS